MYEKELRKAVEVSQEYIRRNMFNENAKPKRWFININYKERFIKLHPENGKIDKQYEVIKRFKDHLETELRDLRSGKTFWIGLFESINEALGFALIVAKVFRIQTERGLRVTICKDDVISKPIDPFMEE